MKKGMIIFLISLLFICNFMWAEKKQLEAPTSYVLSGSSYKTVREEVFSENFDAGIPDTWTIVDGGDPDTTAAGLGTWLTLENYEDWQGNLYNVDGTPFAFVDSDAFGSFDMDEELITPVIDASGYSGLAIQFDQYFRMYGSTQTGDVDVWDGSAWVNVLSMQETVGAWDAIDHQVIDISAYANAELKVRFHFYEANYDYFWAIDNLVIGTVEAPAPQIFFSEYIEGSSNNKALEIYNAGDTDVDLAGVRIAQSSNGSGFGEYYHTFPAEAVIVPGDVWVITTDQAEQALIDVADEVLSYPSVVHFNGNDARALEYNTEDTLWACIDIIGVPEEDINWDVAGVAEATKEYTLVRKETIMTGNTDWAASAGTNADDSEWIVYDQDTFMYLGEHPSEPYVPGLPPVNLNAEVMAGNDVYLTWEEPNGGGTGGESFADNFDSGEFAEGWEITEVASNPWEIIDPVNPYDGMCVNVAWGYAIDNWLITPEIAVDANTVISFDWNTSYYWSVDPNDNSDLYIKISADGGATWSDHIWTYGELPDVWENFVWYQTVLHDELAPWIGQSVKVAFNLVGDDNADNQLDNVYVGPQEVRTPGTVAFTRPLIERNKIDSKFSLDQNIIIREAGNALSREFLGYNVYKDDVLLNTAGLVTDLFYTDPAVPGGTYSYEVTAMYDEGESEAAGPVEVIINTDPPAVATDPTPADLATNISIGADLMWTNGDGTATIDLYFGTEATPTTAVLTDADVETYDPELAYSTTYYWQVVCKNMYGDTDGPIWSFTTADSGAAELNPPRMLNYELTDVNDVHLTWYAPGGGGTGLAEFSDNFNSGEFNIDWELVQGPGTPGEGGTPYWFITEPFTPIDGMCAAVDWGYSIDTWLITPEINIEPATVISFDWNTSYYWSVDPNDNSDLFIKISLDGGVTWDNHIWTYGELPDVWENFTWYETVLQTELAPYVGQTVKVAFNLVGNDNAANQLDNVYIGEAAGRQQGTVAITKPEMDVTTKFAQGTSTMIRAPFSSTTRDLIGYNVYRDGTMINTATVLDLFYDDLDLAAGTYNYEVTAVYDEGESLPTDPVEVHVLGFGTIEGTVTESIGNAAVEGATITVDEYTATTDAAGYYSIQVVEGTYDVSCTADLFAPQTTEDVIVANEATVTVDFVLDEVAVSPSNVVAVPNAEDTEVDLMWNTPSGSGGINLDLADDRFTMDAGILKFNGVSNDTWAYVFDTTEYTDFVMEYEYKRMQGPDGTSIASVIKGDGVMASGAENGILVLHTAGGSFGVVELINGAFTFLNGGWEETANLNTGLDVTNIITVEVSGDNYSIYINGNLQFSFTNTNFPTGYNGVGTYDTVDGTNEVWWNYINISGNSRIANVSNQIVKPSKVLPSNDYTKSLRNIRNDYIEPVSCVIVPTEIPTSVARKSQARNDRALEGYNVYRGLEGDEANVDTWPMLGSTAAADDTLYTDATWASADPGVYVYAVKAVYTNNNMSAAAFSNPVAKNMEAVVTVNVTTNSGDSADGTVVTLTQTDGDHEYEGTANAAGQVVFNAVWKGDYTLDAFLLGFDPLTQTDIEVDEDTETINIEMQESVNPPVALELIETEDNDVIINWLAPGTSLGWSQGFEDGVFPSGEWSQYMLGAGAPGTEGWLINSEGSHSGTYHIWHDDFLSVASEDWVVSPQSQISVTPTDLIFWEHNYFMANYYEHHGVYVSTGSPDPADGDYELVAEMNEDVSQVWTERTVNLDAYVGQNIYIAFKYVGEWATNWNLDDIVLGDGGATRELLGYNVYRDGDMLNTGFITETTFTDTNVPGTGDYVYTVEAVFSSGTASVDGEISVDNNDVSAVTVTKLKSNYPNPFNPVTTIEYDVKEAGQVSIEVYNVRGQRVKTLVNEVKENGTYDVQWFGNDDSNKPVASGIYFYKMKSGRFTSTKKMILMK